jgi:hypothetical protein
MSIRTKLTLLALTGALAGLAQDAKPGSASSMTVNFPKDSPVTLVSADWGESRTTPRGGAMVLDLRTSLSLRNSGARRIRSITLLVLSQEVTPGGKASVSVPSLDVGPGEVFPVRVDMRLLRPLQVGSGPLVQVALDGVLFDDLSFYGPNRLDSRRSMMVWELEARRDRLHFKSVLEAKGAEGLRREVVESISRRADQPRLDVQVSRNGRATALDLSHDRDFAFLKLPDSPIEPLSGSARISGGEAQSPRIEVRNSSNRAIKYFEVGWIIKDKQGHEFYAASVPASDPDLHLAPGKKDLVLQQSTLRFYRHPADPVAIDTMTGYVSQVEFADGSVWVPSRASLNTPQLQRVLAPSPEEQRLIELYRRKGLDALVAELKKLQ